MTTLVANDKQENAIAGNITRILQLKTTSIDDADLHGTVVMQSSLMDAEQLVDELERLRLAYAKQIGVLSLILKGFSDLFTELTEENERRKWLSRQIAKAEREAARLRLPTWFWRIDAEQNVQAQLQHRARFLQEAKTHADDVWDCLDEALQLSGIPIDEALLLEAIREAGHADS